MKLAPLALLLLVPLLLPAVAESPAAPTLSVEIAAPDHGGSREIASAGFDVVVTNRSTADLRVWREWCSWGYFQLSLEFRDSEGTVQVVAKKARGWDKNFPDFWTLAPGEPLVIHVALDASIWGFDAALSGKTLEARAIFTAKEEGAWAGSVASPWRSYRIR